METVIMSREAMTIGTDKEPPVLFRFRDADYPQWKDRFLDFIDRQELGEEILQSLKEGPAEFYVNADPPLPATQEVVNGSSFSEKQNNRLKADDVAISYLFRGLTNEILACIDANQTAKGLWDALSRIMQGSESGALMEVARSYECFKARDGESLEVTYNRYCRLLNELRKNGIYYSNIYINIKFLNNLKPEWERVATNIMQNQNLSEIDIHALFRNLNPLALVADKRQKNSSSSRGLKVDKEPAHSYESRSRMTVGFKEPPVLFFPDHFSVWKSRFLRFINRQELGKEILQSLKEGPAEFYISADPPLPARQVVNRSSFSEKQNNRIKADRRAKLYLLQGMTDDILACIDSHKTAKGLWDALSKLMQGSESGALMEVARCYEGFKARDGESLEGTYNRYCRLLNELRMAGIFKSNIEINIKFLNNLKPEWKQVAANIMQNQNLSEIDIHALFRKLNPLALVDKEPAQSIESRLVMTIGSDKEPPVLFCRCHYSQWKNRFLSFIDWQELGKEILQSLNEGPAEFYINVDLPLPARREVLNRSSLSEKQNNRLKADKVAKSYLRQGMTNEILACIDSYGTAKGMWDELSKQMQGTNLGACTKMIPCEKYFYSGRSLKLDKEPAQLSDSENDGSEPYEELKDKMKAMTLLNKAFQKPTNTNQRVSSSINYWKTKMLLAIQRESGKALMAEDEKWLDLTDDEEEDLYVNLSQQSTFY
ncbi:hypothetical protein CTI12_AA578870 [Artemisia annua]|uniref:Uncharacterized protein n=1 Tax=Artemisia annua TaxID=35608 RepID=A0A2U1KPL0_ARTAN|nr:hypothetical protein CTI12_AA578870 [Artemisia annua]